MSARSLRGPSGLLPAALVAAACAGAANAQLIIGTSTTPFTDISGTGTSVGTITDDSEINIPAASLTAAGFTGNQLLAGGVDVRVGNNGAVIWNPSGTMEIGWANPNANNTVNQSIAACSTTIAATDTVNGNGNSTVAGADRQLLAVLWDDNLPSTAAGTSCKWQVIGGNLIVQWTNEDHFSASGSGTITYQMIVYSGRTIASGQALVEYIYNDTMYGGSQYQNDGGSATIGYKNWGVVTLANDVEFGTSGGSGNTTIDPAFGGTNMQPKVAGYLSAADPTLPHAIKISGAAAACPVDWDQNTLVEPADIAAFVNAWFASLNNGTLVGDYDGNGLVQPADVSLFVSQWFAAVSAGHCP